jgi:hypothetical protein
MYRPIDPIGLNFPPSAPDAPGIGDGAQIRQPVSPDGSNFMRSQNGPAKAKLLNMHTKALIRPFE